MFALKIIALVFASLAFTLAAVATAVDEEVRALSITNALILAFIIVVLACSL